MVGAVNVQPSGKPCGWPGPGFTLLSNVENVSEVTPSPAMRRSVKLSLAEASAESASTTEHLDVMIRRIARDSMTEIGRVIRDLENVSEMLRNESARISREVSGYASLNQAAIAAMKVMAESLKQWQERPSQNKEAAN